MNLIRDVKKAHPNYTVTELCSLFDVAMSCYYYESKSISDEDMQLITLMKAIDHEVHHVYGKRRMRAELVARGHSVGLKKTAKLMKVANIQAVTPRRKHRYVEPEDEPKYAPNLLQRQFKQARANTHWVGDITYLRTHQGWSYLACVLDCATQEIVGYALSKSPNAELTKEALKNALACKQPNSPELLFHSDQGVQYSAKLFRTYLESLRIKQSMSRRGNCWDNAVMERFFRSLKTERLNNLSFINHNCVVAEVEQYIRFYNYKRRHSSIDYQTPHQKYNQWKKVS